MSLSPLIILNSDDWGSSRANTDAILECFAVGATTSTSAMMFMHDSERAAAIANANGIPAGLHINLTQQFDAPNISAGVLERQSALVRRFGPRRIPTTGHRIYPGRWHYSERLMAAASRAIDEQLAEFRRLYREEPTHFDGHHDVHLCASVWRSAALRAGVAIRNTHHYYVRERALAQRFVFPDVFLSMHDVISSNGRLFEEALQRNDVMTVEVSQHPGLGERAFLLSERWRNILEGRRTGSFLDLTSDRPGFDPCQ